MKICRITFLIVDRGFAFILYALFAGVVLGFTFDSALAKDELCYFDSKETGGDHRGYRYFVTLKERDLDECKECEWHEEYLLGFLNSKTDSIKEIFKERYNKDKEYQIEDINEFSTVCGYLPIPSLELHQAAYFGDLNKIKELTERKRAILNAKDDQGFQPLHIAAVEGHSEIVRYLVTSGADINGKGMYGWAPLHMAVKFNQRDIVQLLLSLKADPRIRIDWGNTPLHNAAKVVVSFSQPLMLLNGCEKE